MVLRYLDFDVSEDEQGVGTFDAMASVTPDHVAAVRAEIDAVLGWANRMFPGAQAALDEGGEWDYDLEIQQDDSPPWQPTSTPHHPLPGQPVPRHTLTLSITGTPQFCEAFQVAFGLA